VCAERLTASPNAKGLPDCTYCAGKYPSREQACGAAGSLKVRAGPGSSATVVPRLIPHGGRNGRRTRDRAQRGGPRERLSAVRAIPVLGLALTSVLVGGCAAGHAQSSPSTSSTTSTSTARSTTAPPLAAMPPCAPPPFRSIYGDAELNLVPLLNETRGPFTAHAVVAVHHTIVISSHDRHLITRSSSHHTIVISSHDRHRSDVELRACGRLRRIRTGGDHRTATGTAAAFGSERSQTYRTKAGHGNGTDDRSPNMLAPRRYHRNVLRPQRSARHGQAHYHGHLAEGNGLMCSCCRSRHRVRPGPARPGRARGRRAAVGGDLVQPPAT
jgi:hypothetical protein